MNKCHEKNLNEGIDSKKEALIEVNSDYLDY